MSFRPLWPGSAAVSYGHGVHPAPTSDVSEAKSVHSTARRIFIGTILPVVTCGTGPGPGCVGPIL